MKIYRPRLYNFGDGIFLPEASSNPVTGVKPRRWTIFAAGLLLIALALVVIYTSRIAFRSPTAMVVVAAIGLAALLLQIRLRHNVTTTVRSPLWLNVLGVVCAIVAVFSDMLRVSAAWMFVAALGASGLAGRRNARCG